MITIIHKNKKKSRNLKKDIPLQEENLSLNKTNFIFEKKNLKTSCKHDIRAPTVGQNPNKKTVITLNLHFKQIM